MTDIDFVFQPMYTYLGNKRKLLEFIEKVVIDVKGRLGQDKLKILDGFTGSTVVARMLSRHASELHTNDMELYSYVAANCFLKQPTQAQKDRIAFHLAAMNSISEFKPGFVTEMYAPKDTQNIQPGERCFFTHENALRIDTWSDYLDTHVERELRYWLLCPLLVQMSTHTNTMGHFKAFIKNKEGLGDFEDSGARVTNPLVLHTPIWNPNSCQVVCHQKSTNVLIKELPPLDLIYYDPPYNQHEYSAYYFLLNLVGKNEKPENVNAVTGLPKERIKSDYNSKTRATDAMKQLLSDSLNVAKYVLVSYNDEGIIPEPEWRKMLEPFQYERIEQQYQRYVARGTKTREGRNEVTEILYLISKKP